MKKNKNWQLIKTEEGINLEILKIRYDYYKNPRNEKIVKTFAITGQDAANVIAKTKTGKIIMVKQFRFGIGDYTLEIAGGMIEKNEDQLTAAQREMREETGYEGRNWRYLGNVQSNPVFMNSLVHHYMMDNAEIKHELQLDDAEDIEIVLLSPEEVYQKIEDGIIRHPHTISAFFLAQKYLLE